MRAALDLMLVAQDGHARCPLPIIQPGSPLTAVRQGRHQSAFPRIYCSSNCRQARCNDFRHLPLLACGPMMQGLPPINAWQEDWS